MSWNRQCLSHSEQTKARVGKKRSVSVIFIQLKTFGMLYSDNRGLNLDLRFGSWLSVLMQEKLPLNVTSVQRGSLVSAAVLCSRAAERDADRVHARLPSAQRAKNQYQERLFGLLHYSVMHLHSNFHSFTLCRPNPGNQRVLMAPHQPELEKVKVM